MDDVVDHFKEMLQELELLCAPTLRQSEILVNKAEEVGVGGRKEA